MNQTHRQFNSPLRVLVAEDNTINQKLAIAALRSLGHSGVLVSDGEKALRCMDQMRFDLILMDSMMPVMDGQEALAEIRRRESQEGAPRTPVIMVTAHAEPGDRERFMLLGADGYVPKPIDIVTLQNEIKKVLSR